jgi:aryl-alcohol dehydrogenase-like predicted oxidoreductase
MHVPRRTLGTSDVEVSALGLGCIAGDSTEGVLDDLAVFYR